MIRAMYTAASGMNAQQANIDANPDHEFYSLNIDSGGMWVRRILDRMLEAEKAGLEPGRPTADELVGSGSAER